MKDLASGWTSLETKQMMLHFSFQSLPMNYDRNDDRLLRTHLTSLAHRNV